MNVIGLFLLLFVVVCVFGGVVLIAGNGYTAPTDSYGHTVSPQTNQTATNATKIMDSGSATIPWIGVIVAVLILVGVFLWALSQRSNHHNFLSRY